MPADQPVDSGSQVPSSSRFATLRYALRRGLTYVLRAFEARHGAKLPEQTRVVLRLQLYPEPRSCGTCLAFEPGGGHRFRQNTTPTFQEVTRWLSPRDMLSRESKPLEGGAEDEWGDYGACSSQGCLTHPTSPDCGHWR